MHAAGVVVDWPHVQLRRGADVDLQVARHGLGLLVQLPADGAHRLTR